MSYTNYNTLVHFSEGMTMERDLNSTHLKFCCLAMQTPSVGEVCEYPEVSSFLDSYLVLELVYVLASCSIKKKKKMRGVTMVTILSLHQQTIMVSTLNVLLLTLNKALPGGRSRITRYKLMPFSLRIILNHASCFLYLSLYALV